MKSKSKLLGALKKDYGKDWIVGYISLWLIDLNDNASVKTKMTDYQMEYTAEVIFDSYSLTVADLTLFFKSIKQGRYGSFFENLSQEKILSWLSKYFDERCEMAQMISSSASGGISVNKDKINKDVIKEMFKNIGEEEVIHSHEKRGVGTRMWNDFQSKSPIVAEKFIKQFKKKDDV